MDQPSPTLSVIGLGKLGAPMAACFASRGFRTIGVDLDPRVVENVNAGRPPVREPGLEARLAAARGRLSARSDGRSAVIESEATFVAVPTPSDEDGGFSLRHVLAACEGIGQAIGAKAGFHLVVLTSTVMPGATGGPVRKTLERASGKRAGADFGLCYSPEFIALGSVIQDLLRPDFLLIGESDPRSGELLAGIYRRTCETDPPLARMSFVNAELAKLAVNTFVTMKISFANTLAQICERLPGGDVDTVTRAVGLDARIGPKYLKGATAYGGPCFPRDNLALASLARRVGTTADLAVATDGVNRDQSARLAGLVRSKLPAGGTVGILGLSYKPDTAVVEESPGVHLTRLLMASGVPAVVYDPAVTEDACPDLEGARFAPSLEACLADSDVVVVVTPWEEFRAAGPALLDGSGRSRVVIDCWRILDAGQLEGKVEYLAVGVGKW